MNRPFEELDHRSTPMGDISLRRRLEPTLRVDVYEVKLDDEFLMSSLFNKAETALATLALADVSGTELDVVVGGLGLGYTARAVLEDPRVRSLDVIEALGPVIDWHDRELVPFARRLTADPRCRLIHDDFFAALGAGTGFAAGTSPRRHAVLVDIDHSPRHLLHPAHAAFYDRSGLERLSGRLQPGGVFGLWSDGPPDDDFLSILSDVFRACTAHVVSFPNFYTGYDAASTVYVARTCSSADTGNQVPSGHPDRRRSAN
jgi:spermidine synthase